MDSSDYIILAVTTLGLVSVCKPLILFLKWLYVLFLRKPKNLREYGSWALITGSTDGIGKAFAFELASKGLNIVLVSRNPTKLKATSDEIRQKYGNSVEIRTIAIDFAKIRGIDVANAVKRGIEGLDIGVLINNVGTVHPFKRYFHQLDMEWIESMIKVNVDSGLWVTKAVLPGMLKKRKGAVLDVSSITGCLPSFPLYTMYASTKSCMRTFTKSIAVEYKILGIDVQCQVSLFVKTSMTGFLEWPDIFVASAEPYIRACVKRIGYEQFCCPYWVHSIQWFICSLFSDSFLSWGILQISRSTRRKPSITNHQPRLVQA